MPFAFDAISFLFSATSLMFIKSKFQLDRPYEKRQLKKEIKEGVLWLWNQPLIRYLSLLTGACNMVGAATPLIIIMIAKSLGAQDTQIGLIFSISGIGGIIGSLIGGQIQRRFSFGQVITATIWIQALMLPLFLMMPHYLFLGVIMGVISLMGPIYNVVQFSYRLSIIPDALQGRVNSAFRLVAFGFNPLGAAIAGFLLEKWGAGVSVAFFGTWFCLFAVITTLNRHVRDARAIGEAE